MEIASDRHYTFDVDREAAWKAISTVERYPTWWPWLRHFGAGGLVTGDRWTCVVRPPLQYTVRFTVTLDEVVDQSSVRARVSGDMVGTATLVLADSPPGCEMRLTSHLEPSSRFLRSVTAVARPLVRFGHDWVIDTGARQFSNHAL